MPQGGGRYRVCHSRVTLNMLNCHSANPPRPTSTAKKPAAAHVPTRPVNNSTTKSRSSDELPELNDKVAEELRRQVEQGPYRDMSRRFQEMVGPQMKTLQDRQRYKLFEKA